MTFLKWYGGKYFLADFIASLIPENHICYCEVFGGAGHVLFAKKPSQVEVYNDLNEDLVTLFRMVRDNPEQLQEKLYLTPYARAEFYRLRDKWKKQEYENELDRAVTFFYLIRASFNSHIGKTFSVSKEGKNQAMAYFNAVDNIKEIAKRLRNVTIENLDFREVIARYDSEDTIYYMDPPYVMDARRDKEKVYKHEMTYEDHVDLINMIKNCKGRWILSGYHNELYDKELKDYYIIEKEMPLWAQYSQEVREKGKEKATEVLWLNFEPPKQMELF